MVLDRNQITELQRWAASITEDEEPDPPAGFVRLHDAEEVAIAGPALITLLATYRGPTPIRIEWHNNGGIAVRCGSQYEILRDAK